jgi:hypothetical protein
MNYLERIKKGIIRKAGWSRAALGLGQEAAAAGIKLLVFNLFVRDVQASHGTILDYRFDAPGTNMTKSLM